MRSQIERRKDPARRSTKFQQIYGMLAVGRRGRDSTSQSSAGPELLRTTDEARTRGSIVISRRQAALGDRHAEKENAFIRVRIDFPLSDGDPDAPRW